MDRGTYQATVHGVTRVGHNLAFKPPPMRGISRKSSNLQSEEDKSSRDGHIGVNLLMSNCSATL